MVNVHRNVSKNNSRLSVSLYLNFINSGARKPQRKHLENTQPQADSKLTYGFSAHIYVAGCSLATMLIRKSNSMASGLVLHRVAGVTGSQRHI